MEKIMVLTPMPSASTDTTTAANPGERRSERNAYFTSWIRISIARLLFVAQRDDGVHAHGARGGQPGGCRGAEGEDERDDHERRRVVGTDAVQLALHEPRQRVGGRKPDPGAEQRQAQRLADDQP